MRRFAGGVTGRPIDKVPEIGPVEMGDGDVDTPRPEFPEGYRARIGVSPERASEGEGDSTSKVRLP